MQRTVGGDLGPELERHPIGTSVDVKTWAALENRRNGMDVGVKLAPEVGNRPTGMELGVAIVGLHDCSNYQNWFLGVL